MECIALAVPVSTAAYTANIGHPMIGVCKTYWAEMRTIPIENVESGRLSNVVEWERVWFLKAVTSCIALRLIFLPVGPFSSFSIGVTIVMWEEIINQLLMLLSYSRLHGHWTTPCFQAMFTTECG